MAQKNKWFAWENINFVQRAFVFSAVLVATFYLANVFLYKAHAQLPKNALAANNTSSFGANASASTTEASLPKTPMLEIHVANNGLILLRGARIISLSADIIRAVTAWDSASFTWEIKTNYFTKIFDSKGVKEALTDVRVGDVISVSGQLTGGGAEPVINTQFVREQL